MLYVDELFDGSVYGYTNTQAARIGARNKHQWCHMWSSTHDKKELIEFALKIGLKVAWFQDRKGFPHFDLVPSKRKLALEKGATEKSLTEFLKETKYAN